MDKKELIKLKKSLLALGMTGAILGTSGCGDKVEAEITTNAETENSEETLDIVPKIYYNFDEYCKYIIRDDEPVKVYNSENVVLFYDKENYDVSEYIYNYTSAPLALSVCCELYDLTTEKMLTYYKNGLFRPLLIEYNYFDWYKELESNNYRADLSDADEYIEGYKVKDYYSLEEIREIEPKIGDCLKAINKVKVKTK